MAPSSLPLLMLKVGLPPVPVKLSSNSTLSSSIGVLIRGYSWLKLILVKFNREPKISKASLAEIGLVDVDGNLNFLLPLSLPEAAT